MKRAISVTLAAYVLCYEKKKFFFMPQRYWLSKLNLHRYFKFSSSISQPINVFKCVTDILYTI